MVEKRIPRTFRQVRMGPDKRFPSSGAEGAFSRAYSRISAIGIPEFRWSVRKYISWQLHDDPIARPDFKDNALCPKKPADGRVSNRVPRNEQGGMPNPKQWPDGEVKTIRRSMKGQTSAILGVTDSPGLHAESGAGRTIFRREPRRQPTPASDPGDQPTNQAPHARKEERVQNEPSGRGCGLVHRRFAAVSLVSFNRSLGADRHSLIQWRSACLISLSPLQGDLNEDCKTT